MKTFKRIANWIKDSKGVATSLIEATATVAVGAVLAGVAVGGAIDAINNSKVQAAIGDVSAIGTGVITFYKDNAFYPLYADGSKTGVSDQDLFFGFLVSENGTFPTDTSSGLGWTIVTAATPWESASGNFGTQPDFSPGILGDGADSIEDQMIRNTLGGPSPTAALPKYPLRGQYNGDPTRGWSGPYITSLPKTDPWGDKYIINVRDVHSKYLTSVAGSLSTCTSGSALPSLAVVVISAGPNRTLETSANQCFNNFAAQGDDVVFRIK